MWITFADLADRMESAGLEVGVELDARGHVLSIRDSAGRRSIRLPVTGGFDRTATVLVLSMQLRRRLRVPPLEPGGAAVVTGSWPEFDALWPARR